MTTPGDELAERANRLKPIPFRPKSGGQCLRDSLAVLLRVPPHWLPERLEHEDVWAWFAAVEGRLDVELEYIHPTNGLPGDEGEMWIAILPSSQLASLRHAVVIRGGRVFFDPDDRRLDGHPLDLNDVRAAIRIKRPRG
jgi:hypothetical protein